MSIKPIVLAIVIILAVVFLLNQNSIEPIIDTNITTKTVIETNQTPKTTPLATGINDLEETIKIQEKEIIKESIAVYDSDPVVDASMIINTHKLCISQLESKLNENIYMKRLKNNLDDKQRKFYNDLGNYCQKIDKQHPEYNLSNSKILRDQLANAKPTSIWGKIINKELDPEELSEYEIEDLIQQNSVAILSDAPKYLLKYYQEVIHWDLESVLQNHQYDYTQHIRQYAHQLHLCNIGTDCGPNSTMMAVLCFYNSQACGLTYPQYVSDVLTQGQQADIQLALTYLQSKYE